MYQICTRCVMDTTDSEIIFDDSGYCNHCTTYFTKIVPEWQKLQQPNVLEEKLNQIKKAGQGNEYDCVIGLSGGVDSSYLTYKSKDWGLRPLLFHVDGGWNTPESENNVDKLGEYLGVPVHKYIVDWDEMCDVQRAFMEAGVPNLDIPQDHLFFAVLYDVAKKNNVKYWLSGNNFASESILPRSWGYDAMDSTHILDIHKKFGKRTLEKFPLVSFQQYCDYYLGLGGGSISRYSLLNSIAYDTGKAREILKQGCGWQDYGAKHGESYFTRFFQSYILPKRFGFEKRRAHLASIVCSGQITRDEALKILEEPLYTPEDLERDKKFVLEKLNYTEADLERLMHIPLRTHSEYKTNENMYQLIKKITPFYNGIKMLAEGRFSQFSSAILRRIKKI